ncbi:hypothetical protein R6Q59_013994 [Mikania micrantha]
MNENSKRQWGNTQSSEFGRYIGTALLSSMSAQNYMNLDILAWCKDSESFY